MAVRPILIYPDKRLRQMSRPVMQFDRALMHALADLEDSRRAGAGAVGIAAPQIAWFERVVIVDVSSRPSIPHHGHLVLINPIIVARAGEQRGREGCLSVPDYIGKVARATQIRVRAQDIQGQHWEFDSEGYEARAIQHEIDHLDGMLFLDRIVSPRRDLHARRIDDADASSGA